MRDAMMNIKLFRFIGLSLALFLFLLLLQMCDGNSGKSPVIEETINVTGSWELTTTINSNTFGLQNGETKTEIIYLTDTSGVLTIINFDGHWGEANVDGKTVHFSGSEISDDFDNPATLVTEGTGTASETNIVGTFTTEVYIHNEVSSNNPDGTITSSFNMTKLEETSCLDRASFGDPANSDYILPYPVGASYLVRQQ